MRPPTWGYDPEEAMDTPSRLGDWWVRSAGADGAEEVLKPLPNIRGAR